MRNEPKHFINLSFLHGEVITENRISVGYEKIITNFIFSLRINNYLLIYVCLTYMNYTL